PGRSRLVKFFVRRSFRTRRACGTIIPDPGSRANSAVRREAPNSVGIIPIYLKNSTRVTLRMFPLKEKARHHNECRAERARVAAYLSGAGAGPGGMGVPGTPSVFGGGVLSAPGFCCVFGAGCSGAFGAGCCAEGGARLGC